MSNLLSVQTMATRKGMTRQGMSQALARSVNAPDPAMIIGVHRLYDEQEFEDWWASRVRWVEKRERGQALSVQSGLRVTQEEADFLNALRRPGETFAAACRRVLAVGIAEARRLLDESEAGTDD